MVIINSWESSQDFDSELSKIEHYSKRHHPEMMPFIGSHYNKSRILLVGESHFYEYNDNNNQEFEIKYLKRIFGIANRHRISFHAKIILIQEKSFTIF